MHIYQHQFFGFLSQIKYNFFTANKNIGAQVEDLVSRAFCIG